MPGDSLAGSFVEKRPCVGDAIRDATIKLILQTTCWKTCFLIRKRSPPPKPLATENHSREEPVRLPRSKDNQDNMIAATQLKKTRHKFVTETGSFRSAPRRCLKASGPLALKRNPPLQRTEARFTSSPSFFYRHNPPTGDFFHIVKGESDIANLTYNCSRRWHCRTMTDWLCHTQSSSKRMILFHS